jgi:hypothetical protein
MWAFIFTNIKVTKHSNRRSNTDSIKKEHQIYIQTKWRKFMSCRTQNTSIHHITSENVSERPRIKDLNDGLSETKTFGARSESHKITKFSTPAGPRWGRTGGPRSSRRSGEPRSKPEIRAEAKLGRLATETFLYILQKRASLGQTFKIFSALGKNFSQISNKKIITIMSVGLMVLIL